MENRFPKRGPGQIWTKRELAVLRRLFRQGIGDEEIAIELGRSSRSVALKRYKLGLRRWASKADPKGGKFGDHRGQRKPKEHGPHKLEVTKA